MMEFKNISRPSAIAGTWYSDERRQLSSQVDAFIRSAKVSENEFSGKLFGIISPHAGYRYSGKTAGYAYRTAQGIQRDLVVVLSPFHQFHTGDILTTAFDNYQTPLGKIPVAVDEMQEMARELAKHEITLQQITRDPEHALEIQLPFLQRALAGEFKLIPFMLRSWDQKTVQTFARCLMEVLGKKPFLIVASTDLSHFYPLEVAQELDAKMLRRIKSLDAEGVISAEQEGAASACGAASVAALLYASKQIPDAKAFILNYSTSADDTGDTTSVVGYGAAAIYA